MVLTLGTCGNTDFPAEGNADADSESAVLIAYFSWSGNTRQLAEVIQEQRDNIRPEISRVVEDMSQHDDRLR